MGGTGRQQWQQPPWEPPPARRRSRWLTVGLPVAVVAVLGGLVAVVVVTVAGFTGALDPAQRAAGNYVTALVERRWEDAHAMFCERTARDMTADDLERWFGEPPLAAASVDGIDVSWVNGNTTGQAEVTFETAHGQQTQLVLPLAEEDGHWRPCY